MKILQVIPSLSPQLGGPTKAILQLTKNLQNSGADVQILTTDDNTDKRLNVPLYELTNYHDTKVTFLPRTIRAKEFIYSSNLQKWQQQHLSSFDIVHTHYIFSYLSSWTARAARNRNIPYLMRPLGQLTPWALSQSYWKKHLYRKFIEDKNLQKASIIHCTSPGEVSDVANLGFNNPKLCLPLGVELAPLDKEKSQSDLRKRYSLNDWPILLFLSRLHIKKRVELLFQVIYEWKQRGLNVNLLVAGSGDTSYEQHLREQVRELEINDHVIFTGFIDGAEKQTLLQGSDLFLLPSHSENFGVAVAEALASATAVAITPDVQIAPWVDKASAGWVIPGLCNSWVCTLEPVLRNPHMLVERGLTGRQLAATSFSWSKIVEELLIMYTHIKNNENFTHCTSVKL